MNTGAGCLHELTRVREGNKRKSSCSSAYAFVVVITQRTIMCIRNKYVNIAILLLNVDGSPFPGLMLNVNVSCFAAYSVTNTTSTIFPLFFCMDDAYKILQEYSHMV